MGKLETRLSTHFELLNDCGGIVCDEKFVNVIDDDFVHSVRPVSGSDSVGELLASADVAKDGFFQTRKVL